MRLAAWARLSAACTSEGLIDKSAAICANGGRFGPYPQSLRITTMSWGLSAMASIIHSLFANSECQVQRYGALFWRQLGSDLADGRKAAANLDNHDGTTDDD